MEHCVDPRYVCVHACVCVCACAYLSVRFFPCQG
uniref:Uncharacterized protein n=1 Tax=Rhizophora mucronata TaxID=61149 RepID=A0A2P2NPD2_RHIMU